jgi:hypothetical protein
MPGFAERQWKLGQRDTSSFQKLKKAGKEVIPLRPLGRNEAC